MRTASKTGGRPARLYAAEDIIAAAEDRLLLSQEQAESARQELTALVDKGDKGDNN